MEWISAGSQMGISVPCVAFGDIDGALLLDCVFKITENYVQAFSGCTGALVCWLSPGTFVTSPLSFGTCLQGSSTVFTLVVTVNLVHFSVQTESPHKNCIVSRSEI